jgi:beta-lactamase regulating signal transducer with metallopeptidase domain/thiol-disulfide isomerase/thioredoxin/uncharacterized GH25 family protein
MSTLIDWYPGDRVLDFFLIVALGVTLLSTVAWVVAWRLPTRPAIRHLVLVSALICCLSMSILASVCTALGWTLIAIPLLPAQPVGRDSESARVMAVDPRVAHPLHQPDGPTLKSRFSPQLAGSEALLGASPFGLDPIHPASGGSRPGMAGVAAGSAGKPPEAPDQDQAVNTDAWSARYRAVAMLVLIAWGCGSVLLLLNLVRNSWLIRRLRNASSPMGIESFQFLLEDVGRLLGVRRLPQVVVSRGVMTPFAVGFRRPIVVLPERLLGAVGVEEMRDVLMHEVAHIRRRDHLIVLLQELARALYWPIVTVHGLIRELGQAREELCDNHVLRGRDALSYGETLLHLAELSWEARPLRTTVGILHWKGALERRIAGLLDQRRSTMTGNNRWLACLVALAFIGGGTITAAMRFIAAEGAQAPTVRQPASKDTAKKAEADTKPKPAPNPPAKRSILIHAVGPDGKPMAGVNISRSVWTRKPLDAHNLDRATDERGEVRFDVPETTNIYRLFVSAQGYVPMFAGWEESEHPEQSLPQEFTFHLKKGTVIGGIVRNQDGKPIQGATVEVRCEGGEADGRAGPLDWLATGNDARTTDAEGRWSLDNVPAGDKVKVRLLLNHRDYISDQTWGGLQEKQGVTMEALRARTAAITMQSGVSVTGTVTDPDGQPIAGAVVVRGDHPYWEWGSQEVRTDARGAYRLQALPRGPLTVTAVAPGWMPMQKKVDLQPGLKPVDFPLEPGKELRIRIIDRLGKPIPGVHVQIGKWRGNEALYNHRHPNVLDTQIPYQSNETGLYQWTWAPDDVVTYDFWKEGYATRQAELIADGKEQTITLQAVLRITGKVTDAATGKPIDRFTALPVFEFSPASRHVDRRQNQEFTGGTYTIEGNPNQTDATYRVRIEAEGYRTAMSDAFRIGAFKPTFDFRLERAPAVRGRVVSAQGKPVAGARVYLGTASQRLEFQGEYEKDWSSNQKVLSDAQGAFSFPAQFERYAIVAIHDDGYTQVNHEPDQQPGELALRAWAKVEGRLMQAGQPVASAWILFRPLRLPFTATPDIPGGDSAKTDRDGRFIFTRVPPLKSSVSSFLLKESSVSSNQSIPLDLRPGQRIAVDLGGAGTSVTGRVVPSGDPALATKLDVRRSRNYLIRREPGIEPPAELRSLGFDIHRGWNRFWPNTDEGLAYLQTLNHYSATLDQDGRFQISGVPAGDYDFAVALYDWPPLEGCLVCPVGTQVVRVRVTEEAARKGMLELGDVTVPVRPRLRPGEVVPDLAFTAFSGETVKLSDLRGRYVLFDFWATWCGSCVADLPAVRKLHETYGADKRLVVLGLNLDEDPAKARQFVQDRRLPWTQGSLGGRTDDPVLARFAVSSMPAYFLIGPDGKLIQSGEIAKEVGETLRRRLP